MKVLMITQAVDPHADLLGFVPTWIRALAARVDALYVLAGRVAPCNLPANVEVASLGKESGAGRLTRLSRFIRALKEAVGTKKADVVFAHMNPEYAIAAAPLSRAPVVLWYTHRAVTPKLKLAVRLSRLVVSASRESFCLDSDKLRITGHGIDASLFPLTPPPGGLNLLSVGRLDPSKDMETVVEGAALLSKRLPGVRVTLAGEGPRREALEALAKARGVPVEFLGKVPYSAIGPVYRAADLFVSASRTALDKAVLEAMASGRPAIACNPAFTSWMPAERTFAPGDAAGLAAAAERVLAGDRAQLGREAREKVEREHGLGAMMDRLVKVFEEAAGRKR
ncbi:MAG: glycosyltransferase family 4 protein [Planctomycetia bacterium]|nr:glycosyltransferase family 4 protein [Planctomycetia bacterium]